MHSQLLPTVADEGFEEGSGACLPVDKRVDFPPKKIINLDLGIGSSADAGERGVKRNKKIKQENRESLFTAAQLHEFYNQILVYNLITLGLPVAFHLLLPTWLGVLKSFGPAIYKKYPILADLSLHKSDCSNVMDPEPGRCRRTDGRKWRCSKNVVPQQKYCERHMHRGRQGSRKHVECIKTASRPDITTSDRNKMPTASIVTPDIDDRVIRSSIQSDHSPSPSCHNGIPAILNCRGDESCDINRITVDAFTVGDEVKKNVKVDCYTASNMSSTNEKNHAELNTRKTDGWRQSVARNSYEGFVSSRFGLSPTSVLPCAAGKVSPGLGKKSVVEAEPQRCRRTDGKKWQCRRDTLPNQKYCEAHMHRGAKKIVLTPQSVSGSPARKAHTRRVIPANLDNGINLNTVPTSPQHSASENNSTSSMSDATTITDENISRCLKHSPQN